MDVSSQSTADGDVVIQYVDHSGANQRWHLVNEGNGYYTLVNRNSGKVLDVPKFGTICGWRVCLLLWDASP